MGDERLERARLLYERATFGGDRDALALATRDLDAVEADLALARGRILHAGFFETRREDPQELALFERARDLYRTHGDGRAEGEAQLWIGIFHQVVRGDEEAALPALERAHELATAAGDKLTESYVLRHLAFADQTAGRLARARERHEQSVRLRFELGFMPGVAAGLLALAELAAREGRREDAAGLLAEAEAIAGSSDAEGVRRWIEGARDALA
jgi:tetratricopeptide (TPR) repeat protein